VNFPLLVQQLDPANHSFTVSVRGKTVEQNIFDFLSKEYDFLSLEQIDSVFGFVDKSTLYGGRPFVSPELNDIDVLQLYKAGIGVRLPLTNKYVNRDEYEENQLLLQKYHKTGNTVIVVSDDLAGWIREDFPLYRIEGSVIKDIDNHNDIEKSLELFDAIILAAAMNDNVEFLEKIKNKDAITLFANSGCAYNCPSKICYTYISRMNKNPDERFACSKRIVPREELGMVTFNLNRFIDMGFSRFKLLRLNPVSRTAF